MNWKGVLPAVTTNFKADLTVDHAALAKHCAWMIEKGCAGVVCCGSLGEGQTLTFEEKVAVARTCVEAVGRQHPVVMGIGALSTAEAVALAAQAERAGCKALMVLPPYVYVGDWRETRIHVSTVISRTNLPCMLYNNPAAYKTDFLPEHIFELVQTQPNLKALKESSGDVRRITAARARCGAKLELLVGMDDSVVEGVLAGATGWVAGLANAFPAESVELFNLALRGDHARARALYEWFLPMLRLDTVPKFVQFIKWVQAEVGRGTPHVRPPRLSLKGDELAEVKAMLTHALKHRPDLTPNP